VAYAPCGSQHKDAVQVTLEQIDLIKRFIAQYPKLQFVNDSAGKELGQLLKYLYLSQVKKYFVVALIFKSSGFSFFPQNSFRAETKKCSSPEIKQNVLEKQKLVDLQLNISRDVQTLPFHTKKIQSFNSYLQTLEILFTTFLFMSELRVPKKISPWEVNVTRLNKLTSSSGSIGKVEALVKVNYTYLGELLLFLGFVR
jgi:hypothetical protein